MNAGRAFKIATLASRHSMRSSLHRVAIALAAISSSPISFAFSPSPARKHVGGTRFSNKRVGTGVGGAHDVNAGGHLSSSCLHLSLEDALNESDSGNDFSLEVNGNKPDENDIEEEEDDEVDIIAQKLRRNAENGPINPVKEHDKMLAENEFEAKAIIDGDSSEKSVVYSHSQMLASAVHPDFDLDASTDEAYVESQLKELLSRRGRVLSRLGPGIATLPLDPSSDEYRSEGVLSKRELALQQVMDEAKEAGLEEWDDANLEKSQEKQSEILERANELRVEIDALHIDDCGSVLLANLAFYEAFSLQDARLMKDAWWSSPSAVCLHPSREALVGSNAVVASFTNLFENGMSGTGASGRDGVGVGAAGGVYIAPNNIRGLSVRGNTASLVCDEEVYAKGSAGTIGRRGGPLLNKLLTTNIFRKVGGRWKMAHRHASWHSETTAAQEAIKTAPGIVLFDEEKDGSVKKDRAANVVANGKAGMSLKRLRGDGSGTSKRPTGPCPVPESMEDLDANAVLGVPTTKEKDPKKSKRGGDSDVAGMIGKIINLNDLLGGGSDADGEGKGDDQKAIGDALADMLTGGADSDTTHTTGSGTPEDPFITRRIIKLGPAGIENLTGRNQNAKGMDENVDDDGEQEENVLIDLRGKSKEERKHMLSQLVGKATADAMLEDSPVLPVSAASVRQRCIATLRGLADAGSLSPRQKRVLLTEIITSSARGETSMVEVAYDLLCAGEEERDGADVDTGLEDFTEQCRVFAAMGEDKIE